MTIILFKIVRICHSRFKCNYLKNEKVFGNCLFHFWNLSQILNILEKKVIVHANVIPKLRTVKNMVKPLSKKSLFKTSFDSQHVKGSQTLVKFVWEHVYQIFQSLWGETILKISPLLICEILGMFVYTLTADGKYLVQDCESLLLSIQMKWSGKRKIFWQFLVLLLELHQILNILKKGDPHS